KRRLPPRTPLVPERAVLSLAGVAPASDGARGLSEPCRRQALDRHFTRRMHQALSTGLRCFDIGHASSQRLRPRTKPRRWALRRSGLTIEVDLYRATATRSSSRPPARERAAHA